MRARIALVAAPLLAAAAVCGGCVVAGLVGALGQSAEYQKLLEVPAKYRGLENRSIAIIVQADLSILYEHPDLVPHVMGGIYARLDAHVSGVRLLSPQAVTAWQYMTPQWNAMPYGEIATQLDVDRVVFIEIHEFRLNPPGNAWLWGGECLADVGIVERDSPDPDTFVEVFQVESAFPDAKGVGRDDATATQVHLGVLLRFVRNAAWLFYDHREPKHPDQYDGELNE